MQVKCAICDNVQTLEDDSPEAKRLRNRRIHMFLCQSCYERIEYKTNQRHATGNFKLYEKKKKKKDLI
ncbi:YlaI family protein [Virgibacillus ainsalahensis]